MKKPTQVYLALGSNLGNRRNFITSAIELLKARVKNLTASKIYETEPWGKTDQPKFLNACVGGITQLSAWQLLSFVKALEQQLGRTHHEKWGPREIDIDILFYANEVINQTDLIIPHPFLQERAFVLVPLAELAPNLVHPLLKQTITQLLAVVDTQAVKEFSKF